MGCYYEFYSFDFLSCNGVIMRTWNASIDHSNYIEEDDYYKYIYRNKEKKEVKKKENQSQFEFFKGENPNNCECGVWKEGFIQKGDFHSTWCRCYENPDEKA